MADIEQLASACIKCGFCLESCPTFLLTGDETRSPRGRISLAAGAQHGGWTTDAAAAIDSCVGCRACETACPSGVHYGQILELARAQTSRPGARKVLVKSLSEPLWAGLQFSLASLLPGARVPAFLSWLVSGQSAEALAPTLPLTPPWPAMEMEDLPSIRGEVALLEGCVMRVLYPDVHVATRRLLRRVGYQVSPIDLGCCGALLAHSGFLSDAGAKADRLARALPPHLPLVVNAAGCGSALKEYGQIIGESRVATQAVDASVFLAENGLAEQLAGSQGLAGTTVTYHDACHLCHGQGVREEPRMLLRAIPGVRLVELSESEMCCGSAGTYNVFQPNMARQLLDRKWCAVAQTGADIVALGNPGCQTWIQQAATEVASPIRVMHTLDILEASFAGLRIR